MTESLPLFVRESIDLDLRKPKFEHVDGKFLNYYSETHRSRPYFGLGAADEDTDPYHEKLVTRHYITICDKKFEFEDSHEFNGSVYSNAIEAVKKVLTFNKNEEIKCWIEENFEELLYSARYWNWKLYLQKLDKEKEKLKELQNQIRFREIWANVLAAEALEGGNLTNDRKLALSLEFGMLESEYQKYVLNH
jgi:hypothetical protein